MPSLWVHPWFRPNLGFLEPLLAYRLAEIQFGNFGCNLSCRSQTAIVLQVRTCSARKSSLPQVQDPSITRKCWFSGQKRLLLWKFMLSDQCRSNALRIFNHIASFCISIPPHTELNTPGLSVNQLLSSGNCGHKSEYFPHPWNAKIHRSSTVQRGHQKAILLIWLSSFLHDSAMLHTDWKVSELILWASGVSNLHGLVETVTYPWPPLDCWMWTSPKEDSIYCSTCLPRLWQWQESWRGDSII